MRMRIGILGGTFNPAHNGHLYVARQALKRLRLNKVIFVPAYIPPHKKLSGGAKVSDRLKMLRLATSGERRFSVSEYEIRKKSVSYSIKTVRFLKKKFGKDSELFFLIGSDSLIGLKRWKNVKELLRLLQFAVISRPPFNIKNDVTGVIKLKASGKDISSTRIRKFLKEGRPITRFVPKNVHKYIKRRKLYI